MYVCSLECTHTSAEKAEVKHHELESELAVAIAGLKEKTDAFQALSSKLETELAGNREALLRETDLQKCIGNYDWTFVSVLRRF